MNEIGLVKFQSPDELKCEIREETEKNVNSLFAQGVLTNDECKTLLSKFLSGDVSFGSDGLTKEEAANFTKSDYDEIINSTQKDNNKSKTATLYIIQPGDTPEKIAAKMGFEGVDARNFATKVKANAIKSGMYYSY